MKYSFELKLNIGNYQSVLFGVDDCDSFEEAKSVVLEHINESTGLVIDEHAKKVFLDGK